jgi:hypothetical protein
MPVIFGRNQHFEQKRAAMAAEFGQVFWKRRSAAGRAGLFSCFSAVILL